MIIEANITNDKSKAVKIRYVLSIIYPSSAHMNFSIVQQDSNKQKPDSLISFCNVSACILSLALPFTWAWNLGEQLCSHRSQVAYHTDDLAVFKAHLEEKGIAYSDWDETAVAGWQQIFFYDPGGNILEEHEITF